MIINAYLWRFALACVLIGITCTRADDGEQSFLRKLLAARDGENAFPSVSARCSDPAMCVPPEDCANPVAGASCDGQMVCCSPGDFTMKLTSEPSKTVETEDSEPSADSEAVDDNVQMRSVRGGNFHGKDSRPQRNSDSSSSQERTAPVPDAARPDVTARHNSGYGSRNLRYGSPHYNHETGYGPHNLGYGSPHHNHETGYGTRNSGYGSPHYRNHETGFGPRYGPNYYEQSNQGYYPPPGPYVSYNHIYASEFGSFAPDYYGPQYDVTGLAIPARDLLHKYRFKEHCGIKPINVFPDFPSVAPLGSIGVPVPASNFAQNPWQVAVLGWSDDRGYGLRCSATLVHQYLLITSAHCLSGIIEPELKVLLGVSDLLARDPILPAIERPVARIFVHERYDSHTLSHDVALIQLGSPIDFQFTPHVSPACLPKINQTFVVNNCYILGWTDRNDGFQGQEFQRNEIKVTDMQFVGSNAECQASVSRFARHLNPSKLTQEMHCIKGSSASSCLGSSGGALFCDVPSPTNGTSTTTTTTSTTKCTGHNCPGFIAYLAGIVSWSNGRCGSDSLAIVTELSPYVPWVTDLLAQAGGLKNFDPDYYGYLGLIDGPEYGGGHSGRYGGGHSGRYGGGHSGRYGGGHSG